MLFRSIVAQVVMAVAPSIAVLAAGSLVTGLCSSLLQHFIAITAEVAPPNHRGRALGTQLTAMFSGILFARIVGGLLATYVGWRFSYALSAAMSRRTTMQTGPTSPACARPLNGGSSSPEEAGERQSRSLESACARSWNPALTR